MKYLVAGIFFVALVFALWAIFNYFKAVLSKKKKNKSDEPQPPASEPVKEEINQTEEAKSGEEENLTE